VCLLAFAIDAHPRYPLIVAANRDEMHARPTRDAGWWPDRPDVLGGRDLEAGGSWLGVSRNGRFAAVTNYRDAIAERRGSRSRGHLVAGFLAGADAPVDYLSGIDAGAYAGFNLLVADANDVAYLSNRGAGLVDLDPGIYGLSNATLDTPWHKVTRARRALADSIDADDVSETALLRLLADRAPAPAAEVEAGDTGQETARALSAPFIVLPSFGTRCSTVVTLDRGGRVRFTERRFGPDGRPLGDSRYSFDTVSTPA